MGVCGGGDFIRSSLIVPRCSILSIRNLIPFMISEGFHKDFRLLCELEEPIFSMN
jgi:hypothetical protein